MKKRLSNFFQLLSKDIGFFIFAIVLVPLWIGIFIQMKNSSGAFEPPTKEDYKWLYKQEEKLKENFENVYLIDGASIKIQNSEIKVELVSEADQNYELHMTFDENKKFIKSKEICNKAGYRTYNIAGENEKNGPIIACVLFGMMIGLLFSVVVVAFLHIRAKYIV